MKLFRHGKSGNEKPGILSGSGNHLDLAAFGQDFDQDFFSKDGISRLRTWLEKNESGCPVLGSIDRYGPPVRNPSKIVCIGLNYSDHARETGAAIPKEPVIFFKSTTAISGPNDPVIIPKTSRKTDWEVELAVVIGKRASYISEAEAPGHIGGYMLHNDYSEREFQIERGGQWVKGKSCDSFAPLGPWLVTPDEIPDPGNLRLWLTVNGRQMQNGNSSNLIYKIPFLVSYLSQFMTLLPGDVISTGTPAGVGLGQKPEPFYLKAGDIVELGIDGLGSAKQLMISWEEWSRKEAYS
ncbi:MAG: fumarylacetoacetate hydrolase family protein [Chitinophagales bacterium]